MSKFMIENEVRRMIKMSGLEASPKMVCSIVRIFKMEHPNIDYSNVAIIARKLVNEY